MHRDDLTVIRTFNEYLKGRRTGQCTSSPAPPGEYLTLPGVTVPSLKQEIPLFAAGHVTGRDEMEW